MKWYRPFRGACLTCKAGGNVYYIMDDLEGLYHLEVKPDRKGKRLKFDTYRDVYIHIVGRDPQEDDDRKVYARPGHKLTEKEIRTEIELVWTLGVFGSDNTRTYCRKGQDYAVDMSKKEIWPYWLPQRISDFFNKERECLEWADLYLEERYGQVSLFDMTEGGVPIL